MKFHTRKQRTEVGSRKWEVRRQEFEVGMRKSEVRMSGSRKSIESEFVGRAACSPELVDGSAANKMI